MGGAKSSLVRKLKYIPLYQQKKKNYEKKLLHKTHCEKKAFAQHARLILYDDAW
jgi:hypothetical protein